MRPFVLSLASCSSLSLILLANPAIISAFCQTPGSAGVPPASAPESANSSPATTPRSAGGSPASESEKPNFELDSNTATTLANKIDELVTKKFINKDSVDKIWKPAFEKAKPSLVAETNLLSFSKRMNELLSLLHTSHTNFLTQNDEAFFFMRSLFGSFRKDEKDPHKNDADFTGLGVGGAHTQPNQVRYVLDASPAAVAGFKRGDKIVSVNGERYSGYGVWYKTSSKPNKVQIERLGKPLELTIRPIKQDFLQGYVGATEKSARVIEKNGKKIGYLHFWSGGSGSREALENALETTLIKTDGLVLDLRDGYGGASLEDLDVFFRPRSAFPDMRSWTREGASYERAYYDKPVVAITNRGTRSGKELMSFGLKRSKRGTLVGEPTAGYVVGGEYNPLDSRTMLYLAIVDITLDGERLEGKGVSPDIPVSDMLGPTDPPLQRALQLLSGTPKH